MKKEKVFTKPLLAIIKSTLAELCTHTLLTNLFEKYGFEPGFSPDYSNKLKRTSSYLDHQKWDDSEVTKNLFHLLSEIYLKWQHLLEQPNDGTGNNSIHVMHMLHKALDGNGIKWNGNSFDYLLSSKFDDIEFLEHLDIDSLLVEVKRARSNVETDPSDAITAAESIFVSTCKAILTQSRTEWSPKASPQDFLKCVLEQLEILPDQISKRSKGHGAIKKVLRSMMASTDGLA